MLHVIVASLGFLYLGVHLGAFAVSPAPDAAQRNQSRTRDIYVSVVDSSGAPVKDLTAADFVVREDNAVREVLKAEPATAPIHLALLVDDSQAAGPAIQQMRDGLNAFIDAMAGKAEMALITFGERPTSVVEYTTSTEQLKKGVTRIFARAGSGAYLLDAIVDACRGLSRREADRKALVVVTLETSVEFSNLHYQNVLEQLDKCGATLHVLPVGTPSASQADEMRNRAQSLSEGTQRTGGRYDQILSEIALPDKLRQMSAELNNQYVVTYSRPETLIPPERVSVTVKRPDVKVRSRTRTGGK
jgi:VWFA-related protein